jgi:hypothetical protein
MMAALQNLTVKFLILQKNSIQIINKISKVQQNEKQFNLCRNDKSTTIYSCTLI